MPAVVDFVLKPGEKLSPGKAPAIIRGDTWLVSIPFSDEDGVPVPVVGVVAAQLRTRLLEAEEEDTGDTLLAEVGITIIEHVVTMRLEPDVTVDLPNGWVWDLQQIASGITTTLFIGKGKTLGDVTRPNTAGG